MKTILLVIISLFLLSCSHYRTASNMSVLADRRAEDLRSDVFQTLAVSDAVDILSDETLTVEERIDKYLLRMDQISKDAKKRLKEMRNEP